MRKQFVKTVEEILAKNDKTILILGDIGVFGFRKSFELYMDRVFNIGILEQSTISLAAGLNITGFIPIIHTIAPFVIERCFEQIKIDFGYQRLGGNIVSVGASYDYAALGCTHHCPADVPILANIPGIEIVVPGSAQDFDILFKQSYDNGKLTYFRLSEKVNKNIFPVKFGRINVIKKGVKATIIAVGPLLDKVIAAAKDLNVTILYVTTIRPLDKTTLKKHFESKKILICEPYYSGAITGEIISVTSNPIKIDSLGVPCEFLHNYGTLEEHDEYIGFTPRNIRNKVKKLINE